MSFYYDGRRSDNMIRAIVIDDDKETVDLFSELLQGNGIQVVGKGYNGQDAVFLYKKLKPNVVYLDDTMPVYDGAYALQKIKELDSNANVIMIIGKTSLGNEVKIRKFSPSAVITEPIDINEIIKKTHQICAPTLESIQEMNKTLVTLVLKNTLLELGIQEYDKVVSLLQKDFNCVLEDCYEHPEYLKQVLHDLFGKSYSNILGTFTENLKSISEKSAKDFIQSLNS